MADMANTINQTMDTILRLCVALIEQYASLLASDTSDDDDDISDDYVSADILLPRYREPIAYERKNWSLAGAGWGDTECLEYLRFTRAEIVELVRNLGLAEWADSAVKMPGGYRRCPEQALCILLYRLASPGPLKDMMHVFGVSRSQISSVVNDLGSFLYERYHRKLLWDYQRLSSVQLHRYVQAINATVGEPMGTWGFIDCTVRPIARPTKDQQLFYSEN